jgi:hypothetical protein
VEYKQYMRLSPGADDLPCKAIAGADFSKQTAYSDT